MDSRWCLLAVLNEFLEAYKTEVCFEISTGLQVFILYQFGSYQSYHRHQPAFAEFR